MTTTFNSMGEFVYHDERPNPYAKYRRDKITFAELKPFDAVCGHCGKAFTYMALTNKRRYCSNSCQQKATYRRRKARMTA